MRRPRAACPRAHELERGVLRATGMRRLALGAIAAAILAGGFLACGSARMPAPPYVQHPTLALEPIPYPPPPARVEYVPPRPRPNAVWLDGEWAWQARRWAWKPGRWVVPPPNARFAPWVTVRNEAGALFFAEGAWRDAYGKVVPPPPPLAVGKPTFTLVVTAEGEDVPTSGAPPPEELRVDAGLTAVAVPDAAPPLDASSLLDARALPWDAATLELEPSDAASDAMPLPDADDSPTMEAP